VAKKYGKIMVDSIKQYSGSTVKVWWEYAAEVKPCTSLNVTHLNLNWIPKMTHLILVKG